MYTNGVHVYMKSTMVHTKEKIKDSLSRKGIDAVIFSSEFNIRLILILLQFTVGEKLGCVWLGAVYFHFKDKVQFFAFTYCQLIVYKKKLKNFPFCKFCGWYGIGN